MKKIKFEVGREGKIIARSLGKIGFPKRGWSPQAGETCWVEVEEKERVCILSPATGTFDLDPRITHPQLKLDGDEFMVYEARLRVSKGKEIGTEYVPLPPSSIYEGRLSVSQTGNCMGVRFSVHADVSEGFLEVRSEVITPPFSELPEKYRLMAEHAWHGHIISPGLWMEDATLFPKSCDEIDVLGNGWTEFGPCVQPIAVADNSLITKKARLLFSREGVSAVYEGEIWEAYYETPFGIFPAPEGKIETRSGCYGQLCVPLSSGNLKYEREAEWKRIIAAADSRIVCQFCYSPKAEERSFLSEWTEVIESHGSHAPDSRFPHNEVVSVKICPVCVEKGREGKLYTVGIRHHEGIKLFDEVVAT